MVTVFSMVAGEASINMTTQCSGATLHNRLNRLRVRVEQIVTKFGTVSCAKPVENIGQRHHGKSAR
jgi:hypothetical protein